MKSKVQKLLAEVKNLKNKLSLREESG